MKRRHSIRLKHYDYAQDGAYFVTICTHQRAALFGDVTDGEMTLNTLGCVADDCWWAIPAHFSGVELDAFVVMPNHVHGIVIINRWEIARPNAVEATHASPLQPEPAHGPKQASLAAIIGSYKSAVTRQTNRIRQRPGAPVWQRNYYEHIIRTDRALNAICKYILYNPARWADDEYFV